MHRQWECAWLAAASHDHLLLGVVESDSLSGLNRGNGHAERDGMTVARFDVGVGGFAAADTLQPVPNVVDRHVVVAGVRGSGGRGVSLGERNGWKKIRFHIHFPCEFFGESTFRSDLVFV